MRPSAARAFHPVRALPPERARKAPLDRLPVVGGFAAPLRRADDYIAAAFMMAFALPDKPPPSPGTGFATALLDELPPTCKSPFASPSPMISLKAWPPRALIVGLFGICFAASGDDDGI